MSCDSTHELRVLHVLPHRGGGAEVYIDMVEHAEGFVHERAALSGSRTALSGGPSVAWRWPAVAKRALEADVLHVHGDVASVLSLPLLAARPSVMSTQGLHFLRRARGSALVTIRFGLRVAIESLDRVICSSRADRELIAELVPDRLHERLAIVPSGIAVPAPLDRGDRARVRAALGVHDGEVLGVFMAELELRKRPLVAIVAAERARANGAPFVLAVAGDGPNAAEVATHAGPAVRVLGYRDDRARLLGAADVFVMPSEREGFSLALLEAMACGVATVVSDGAGNPEVVGEAGVVVALDDVDGLAAAFTALCTDEKERARLGAAAQARVRAQFPYDDFLSGVTGAYRHAVRASARPRRR